MSNARQRERKKEIEILREEGRQAALAGKHRQACPQAYIHNMNRGHWLQGYDDGEREVKQRENPMGGTPEMEEMDAAVFSGDMLFTHLAEFKEYLARWQRAVEEHETLFKDEEA